MPTSSRPLFRLLESVAAGVDPETAELAALSDLDKVEAGRLRDAWPTFPPGMRASMMERARELADGNIELDFTHLARVGLSDADAKVRFHAIDLAWESNDRDIALTMAKLVTFDGDEPVRAAAASGLANFVLMGELGALDRTTVDTVTGALRNAASSAEESVDVRARAVESLGARSLDWVETLITDAYYADDRRLRLAAIRAMGNSADERWTEYLEEQATSDDQEFRLEVTAALGSIASVEAAALILDLLEDEDLGVALAAIVAAGEIGSEELMEALAVIAQDEESERGIAARLALEESDTMVDPVAEARNISDDD